MGLFFHFLLQRIRDEARNVGGLFHPVIAMTTKMLSQRRTWALRDLAARTSNAKSVGEALALFAAALAECDLDLPLVPQHAVHSTGDRARLIGSTDRPSHWVAGDNEWEAVDQSAWPLEEMIKAVAAKAR